MLEKGIRELERATCWKYTPTGPAQAPRSTSWRAQLHLTKRFRHLRMRRKLAQNKVCVAIAREPCGFLSDITRQLKTLL